MTPDDLIDIAAIRQHCELLHRLAAPLKGEGKLSVAGFGEDPEEVDPKTGKPGNPLMPIIQTFEIGQIEPMAAFIASLAAKPNRNVYAPLAVWRRDLGPNKKGGERDVVASLGIVADFDDDDAENWSARLPVPAPYVIETSRNRFQPFLLFDQPYPQREVKPVAVRLKGFCGCDHGTADISHVWRVPGTLNWPNYKKLADGRAAEPQLVRVIKPLNGQGGLTLAELAAALPPKPEAKAEAKAKAKAKPADEPPESDVSLIMRLLPEKLRRQITEPGRGDRSKALFSVIKQLADRGVDAATIERIIRAHPSGVGAKYVGRADLDKEIARVITKPRTPLQDDAIDELNKTYAVIRVVNRVAILNEHLDPEGSPSFSLLSSDSFKLLLANQKIEISTVDKAGEKKLTKVPLAPLWLAHPDRRQYEGITFAPQTTPPGYFNLWTGFAKKPAKSGSCELFKAHLRENVCGNHQGLYNWVFGWFADIFQSPTEKSGTSLVLRGAMGVGKTIVGDTFGCLLGLHYVQVADPRYVTGRFNAHLIRCLLLHCDEAFWAGDRSAEGKLKDLVTGKRHPIELKGFETFFVPNYVRLFIGGNPNWLVPAGMDERRFATLDVAETHKQDIPYFKKIVAELNAGGYEKLLDELLTFDLAKVNLRIIPKTHALLDQKIASLTPEFGWWLDILKNGQLPPSIDQGPGVCPGQILYDHYIEHAQRQGARRRAIETAIGIFLRSVAPDLQTFVEAFTVKKATKFDAEIKNRGTVYSFPPLEDCRENFAKKLQQSIPWPEPHEWEASE